MSMSTHVIGFRPPNAKFDKMLAAYRTCEEADVAIPDDVWIFFNHEPPDESGVIVEDLGEAKTEWRDEDKMGIQIDISKLPPGITVLRFYNSW